MRRTQTRREIKETNKPSKKKQQNEKKEQEEIIEEEEKDESKEPPKKPKKKKKKKKNTKATKKPPIQEPKKKESSENSSKKSVTSSEELDSNSNNSPFINFSNFHYGAPPQPPAPINGYYWYPIPIGQNPYNMGSFYSGRYVEKSSEKKNKKKKKKKKKDDNRKFNSMRHMPSDNKSTIHQPIMPQGNYFPPPPQPYYFQGAQPPANNGNSGQNPNYPPPYNLPPYAYANPPQSNYLHPQSSQPMNYPPNYGNMNRNPQNNNPYVTNFKSEHMVKYREPRGGENLSNYGESEFMPRYGSEFNIMDRGGRGIRGGGVGRVRMPPQPGFTYKSSRSMMHDYYQRGGRFDAGEIIESEEDEESEESLNKAEL